MSKAKEVAVYSVVSLDGENVGVYVEGTVDGYYAPARQDRQGVWDPPEYPEVEVTGVFLLDEQENITSNDVIDQLTDSQIEGLMSELEEAVS